MYQAEKEAKEFLEKKGFKTLNSIYVKNINDVERKIKNLNFPIVIKVFGKNIVHKKKLGGVKLNVKNHYEILKYFKKFKKIGGSEGIIIQEQISGKEILLGVKKTPEFGHVIVFGSGGSNVEKLKDISFRVCPFNENDALEMIKETKIFSELNKKEIDLIIKNILKLKKLIKKFSKISELDINPLVVNNKKANIVDARIVWE